MQKVNEKVFEAEWEARANAVTIADIHWQDQHNALVCAWRERVAAQAREAEAQARTEQARIEHQRLADNVTHLEVAAEFLTNPDVPACVIEDLVRGDRNINGESIAYLRRPRFRMIEYIPGGKGWVWTEWGQGVQKAVRLLTEAPADERAD